MDWFWPAMPPVSPTHRGFPPLAVSWRCRRIGRTRLRAVLLHATTSPAPIVFDIRTRRLDDHNTNWILLLIFFFNDAAATEIYTLSLHDALPIYQGVAIRASASFLGVLYLLGPDGLVLASDASSFTNTPRIPSTGGFLALPANRTDKAKSSSPSRNNITGPYRL